MANVDLTRIPSYYHRYILCTLDDELDTAFQKHLTNLLPLLQSLPPQKWDYRYAEGKWSIKELVQHLIDAERIFCYRALCFARKDATPIPGFDENEYVVHSRADQRDADHLLKELSILQQSSALLFQSFNEDQLENNGIANGNNIYVKGIGYIIIGHALHHKAILEERYLP